MPEMNRIQDQLRTEIAALSKSINSIILDFRQLRSPLTETRSKVPQATSQLDRISEQTEAAAHRMLDVVEQLTQRDEEIVEGLTSLRSMVGQADDASIITLIESLQEKASTNLNDSYSIMDALQFQDITSQQMNHAASLLEEIEERIRKILSVVSGNSGEEPKSAGQRQRVFDPHADFTDRRTEQAEIDSLFNGGEPQQSTDSHE